MSNLGPPCWTQGLELQMHHSSSIPQASIVRKIPGWTLGPGLPWPSQHPLQGGASYSTIGPHPSPNQVAARHVAFAATHGRPLAAVILLLPTVCLGLPYTSLL